MKKNLILVLTIFLSFSFSFEFSYHSKEDMTYHNQQPQYKKESSIKLEAKSDLIKKLK